MIQFDAIPDLIRQLKTPIITVRDMNDNKLYKIDETNVETTINKLDKLKSILQQYGRVYIIAQTQNEKKQTTSRGYNWEVHFTNSQVQSIAAAPVVQPQSNNSELLKLQLEVEKMKLQNEWNEKERLLKEKYKEKNKFGFDPQWMPLIGKFLGMKKEDILDFMSMSAMANSESLQQKQLSGNGQTAQLNMQLTPEEMQKLEQEIITGMQQLDQEITSVKLSELLKNLNSTVNKNNVDKINMLLKAIQKNPSVVDTALTFLK